MGNGRITSHNSTILLVACCFGQQDLAAAPGSQSMAVYALLRPYVAQGLSLRVAAL